MAIAHVGDTITLAVFCCATMPWTFNKASSMTRACLKGVGLDDMTDRPNNRCYALEMRSFFMGLHGV